MPKPPPRSEAVLRAELESQFPGLVGSGWVPTSDWDPGYKCIAWAASESHRHWWPIDDPPFCYWPTKVFDDKVDTFVEAFGRLGYKKCDSREFEVGYQKVAIYATVNRRVKHMARQHFLGKGWLSKLGGLEDILHLQLRDIEGDASPLTTEYGEVVQILKRNWITAIVVMARQKIKKSLGLW